MEFEWDENKATNNKLKHGVSFDLATTVFDDYYALVSADIKHSSIEERLTIIGESDSGILVVIITIRGIDRKITRIISARKANKKERQQYENYRRISV